MAAIVFYMYPDAFVSTTHPETGATQADTVDDPQGSHDGWTGAARFYAHSTQVRNGDVFWSLTAPTAGLATVDSVKVHIIDAIGTAGPDQWTSHPAVSIAIKPTTVKRLSAATHTVSNHFNDNTDSWTNDLGTGLDWIETTYTWTTNPDTAGAWAVADLTNLQVGADWTGAHLDTAGGASPNYAITSIYVEVSATTSAPSLEVERVKGSTFLRLFRRPLKSVSMDLPPHFADVDLLDNMALSHYAAPAPGGQGVGTEAWKRRDLIVMEQGISPDTGRVRIRGIDAREYRCGLWSPLYNTLTASEIGDGVALLDAGGGRTTTRNVIRYAERPHPVALGETVRTYAPAFPGIKYAVGVNKEAWDRRGLHVEGGAEINLHLYNTFASGYSPTWSLYNPAPATGTWSSGADPTDDFEFDVGGYRQCVKLTQGAGPAQKVGVYQAQTLNGSTYPWAQVTIRVHILTAATSGNGTVWWRLWNATDTTYWDDSLLAWRAGVRMSGMMPGCEGLGSTQALKDLGRAGYRGQTTSRPIPLVAGAKSYQLFVAMGGGGDTADPGGAGGVFNTQLANMSYSATRTDLVAAKGVFPITTAPVTQVADVISFSNAESVRFYDASQGTFLVRVMPEFNHADMADGDSRYIAEIVHDLTPSYRDVFYYSRTDAGSGYFAFLRNILGVFYTALSGNVRVVRGGLYHYAARWSSALGEVNGSPWATQCSVDGVSGPAAVGTGPVAYGGDATDNILYLGHSAAGTVHFDGYLTDLEILPFVLTDEEVARRSADTED